MVDVGSSPQYSHHVVRSSQTTSTQLAHLTSTNMFASKLSIKLKKNNFLLWYQQVKRVIFCHKLHKMAVNPHIPPMFKTNDDRVMNIVSKDYEEILP